MSESVYFNIISALNANESAQAAITAIVQGLVGAILSVKPDSKGKVELSCNESKGLAQAIYDNCAPDTWKDRRNAINMMANRASKALGLDYKIGFGCSFKEAEGQNGKYWAGESCFRLVQEAPAPEIVITDAMVVVAGALRALAGADARTIAKALTTAKDAAEPTFEELNAAMVAYAIRDVEIIGE